MKNISVGGGLVVTGPNAPNSVAPSGGRNGLSNAGGFVVLGQNVGEAGSPASLLSIREIPLNGFRVNFLMPNGQTLGIANVGLAGSPALSSSNHLTLFAATNIVIHRGIGNTFESFPMIQLENGQTITTRYSGVLIGYSSTAPAKGDLLITTSSDAGIGLSAGGDILLRPGTNRSADPTLVTQFEDNNIIAQPGGTGFFQITNNLVPARPRFGIGAQTPAAVADLQGSADGAAGSGSLKIRTGVPLVSITGEEGVIENTGDALTYVQATGPTRRTITLNDSTLASNARVAFYNGGVLQGSGSLLFNVNNLCLSVGGGAVASSVMMVLGAGTTAKAPFRYTAGTNATTIVNGNKEFDGSNEFVSVGGVRYTLAKTLTGNAVLDFPNTATLAYATLTATLTGAAVGDPVFLGVPNGSRTPGAMYDVWVSAANQLTIQFFNGDTLPQDPASGTFNFSLQKL